VSSFITFPDLDCCTALLIEDRGYKSPEHLLTKGPFPNPRDYA